MGAGQSPSHHRSAGPCTLPSDAGRPKASGQCATPMPFQMEEATREAGAVEVEAVMVEEGCGANAGCRPAHTANHKPVMGGDGEKEWKNPA